VLEGLSEEPVIPIPRRLAKQLEDTTLLVYFSPGCPHCVYAQPELNALAGRLEGRAAVLGIASGSATQGAVDAYRVEHRVPFPLIRDADRSIAAAMGVRGTPSALLVRKRGRKVVVLDGWYPYHRGQAVLVELRLAEDPWTAFRPGEYHGNVVCGTCHPMEMDAWQLTHHSVAWHTLVKGGTHTDPECTSCHVTGAGAPGGWDGDPNSHLVNVGCESCHGPGGPHDGVSTDETETCGGCHDSKHSIAFTYAKGLPLLDHYRANDMDDRTWHEQRRTLLDGAAPHDLLALPEGAHVGADACQSCHEAQHEAWKASSHATAMATLTTEEAREHAADAATNVSCVRCHATAEASGPPPSELSHFLLEEGVGCESCHGPGETHVAAEGGTGNIVALGEDCPVCVLEALCTRCHTQAWDPDWDLVDKLERVRHGDADPAREDQVDSAESGSR
jgi:peroxiredoxin